MRPYVFCFCLFSTSAFAQELTVGADAAGRAGASVATPQGDSALFVNPAGASLTPSLVTGFLYELQPKEGQTLSVLAVDGTAPYIDGGVATTTFFSEDVNLLEERSIASMKLGQRSALGFSQTYLFRDDLPKGDRNFFSADAGLLVGLGDKASFGMALSNFPNNRPIDRRRILDSGVSFIVKNVRFSGEGGVNLTPEEPNRFIGHAAVEWARFSSFTLRSGYVFDATAGATVDDARQSAALGFTYHDERSTFDIAYEQNFAGEGFSRLTVGIRFFLPGMNKPADPNQFNKPANTPNPSRYFGGTGKSIKGSN
jgi:hypothetical protein